MIKLNIRLETPADYRTVEEITRDAFWREGTDEHYLVHILRSCPDFIPELDFVAEAESGRIVGNIMYSKAEIRSAEGTVYPVITFGPLTVAPEFQRQGVGQALMGRSIEEAKKLGYRAIVFYGHPDYYPRRAFAEGLNLVLQPKMEAVLTRLWQCPFTRARLMEFRAAFTKAGYFKWIH